MLIIFPTNLSEKYNENEKWVHDNVKVYNLKIVVQ